MLLFLANNLWADKVISYIGYSDASQGDADNAAYAGVAKQISADVQVVEKMEEQETILNEKSQYSGNFSVQTS